jgi:hypothetical protein
MRKFAKIGVLYCSLLVVLYRGCSAQTPNYRRNISLTGNWIVSSASWLPDGAILFTPDKINPYFSNLAAIGLTKDRKYHPQVKAWMQWYIRHLNHSDKWGLHCSMYDYGVSGTAETPLNDADSTDSYAATFLSLAWAFWQTGDDDARAYIKAHSRQLSCIAGVLIHTQQSNGLTWAKPDYQIQFLMDNTEVYRGLRDAASLLDALQKPKASNWYSERAELVAKGIRDNLWDAANGNYFTYVGAPATDWTDWYPDSTAQLFPVLHGVISPSESRAQELYETFNQKWPNWTTQFADPFPWVAVSGAAARMGDRARVNQYIQTIQTTYVATGFPYPWYCAEAGWFMRVNNFMLRHKRPKDSGAQCGDGDGDARFCF